MPEVMLPARLACADSAIEWAEVFGFDGPLELEVGSGHGGFAAAYAALHPSTRLVAIEQRRKYAEQTSARCDRKELRNVAVVCADAALAVPRLFADATVSAVHIHFPDPWWKRRHHRRRLITERFAQLLYRKLAAKGRVDLRTDVAQRALEMLRVLESAGFANLHGELSFAPARPDEVPSSREARYLKSGERVYRLELVRP